MIDRSSKFKSGANSCLVDPEELMCGTTQVLKPHKNPKFSCCSLGDVVNMCLPAEVVSEGDAQQLGLVNNSKVV